MSKIKRPTVAIFLSWPREIDFYSSLISILQDEIIFIIDDLQYSEPERVGNADRLQQVLLQKGHNFQFFSKLSKRYPVCLSTGLSYQESVSLKSLMKRVYGLTVGQLICALGFDRILKFYFGRPFTAGGLNATIFEQVQVEPMIGKKIIRFPKGLDIDLSNYPEQRWRDIFDLHLCHCRIDKELILRKFPASKVETIGYPKYERQIDPQECKKAIANEFMGCEVNQDDILILWMPTHVKNNSTSGLNIYYWAEEFKKFPRHYHVIVRPHPKTLVTNPSIADDLCRMGFKVDIAPDRDLCELYLAADIVLVDFGASVLSSCYLGKKTIALEFPNDLTQRFVKEYSRGLDVEVRAELPKIKKCSSSSVKSQIDSEMLNPKGLSEKKIRDKLFGDAATRSSANDLASLVRSFL